MSTTGEQASQVTAQAVGELHGVFEVKERASSGAGALRGRAGVTAKAAGRELPRGELAA